MSQKAVDEVCEKFKSRSESKGCSAKEEPMSDDEPDAMSFRSFARAPIRSSSSSYAGAESFLKGMCGGPMEAFPEFHADAREEDQLEKESESAPQGKRRRKDAPAGNPVRAAAQNLEKAEEMLRNKQATYSDEQLWNGKFKTRQLQKSLKALTDATAKVCGEGSRGNKIGQVASDFVEHVEKIHEYFTELRKDPMKCVEVIKPESLEHLCSVQPSVLASVFVFLTNALLKSMEKDVMFCVVSREVLLSTRQYQI